MSDSLATYFVDLQVKTDGLEKELNSLKGKIESQSNTIGNSFKSIAVGVGTVVAGYEALSSTIDFATDSVKAYIESAGAFNKIEAIIKSTGMAAGFTAEQLADISGELSKLAGIDDDKIMNDVTANLLTFKNVSDDVFKSAQQSILDISAVIGSDLKSQTIQLGKALNDPIQGMSALARVGIQFSDSQKEQIKTMIQHNDLLGAQTLMLKEIESEFGGAAQASNTATGGLNNLTVAFGNFKEMVGKVILERMQPFIELGKKFFDWINPQEVKSKYDIAIESTTKLSDRFNVLKNIIESVGSKTTKTAEEQNLYVKSVKSMQSEFANYFTGLDLTKTKFDDIKTAIFNARKELDLFIQSEINKAISQDKLDKLKSASIDLQNAVDEREKGKAQAKVNRDKNDVLHGGKLDNLDNADAQNVRNNVEQYADKFANDRVAELTRVRDEAKEAYEKFVNAAPTLNGKAPKDAPKGGKTDVSTGEYKERFNVELELEKIHAKQVADLRQKELDDAQLAYDTDIDKYKKSLDKKELSQSDYDKLKLARLNQLYSEQSDIKDEYDKKAEYETLDKEYAANQTSLELHRATEVQKLEATRDYLAKKLTIQQEYDAKKGIVSPEAKKLTSDISATDAQILVAQNSAKLDATTTYYEKMKFLDDNYYAWKKGKIKEEYDLNIKNGLDVIEAQKAKNESLKALDEERKAFIIDSVVGISSITNELESVFGNIADAMVGDFDLASMRIKDIMKDLVKNVLQELAKIAAQKVAFAILNLVSGGLGSIGSFVSGLFGGNSGGKSMSGSGGDTGLFANIVSGQGSIVVPPQAQTSDSKALLTEIKSSIQAMNQNIMNKEFNTPVTINSNFSPEDFAVENNNVLFKVNRSGKNLDGN